MPRLYSELATDFARGMHDTDAATAFPKNAAKSIQNGRVRPDGTISRRPGSRRTHATVTNANTGYGAFWFTRTTGVTQLVAIFGTVAYSSDDDGVTWSSIATSLRADYYSFATMRDSGTNYLYLANGDTTVKRWDGLTWDTNPNAPSGVQFLATFNRRLWYAGHSGVTVVGTQIENPGVVAVPNGLSVQVLTYSGNELTGMFQIGPHLLVFDEDATSYIDGFGEQTLIVASGATGFSRSVGCIAFRTVVSVGDQQVCWLSKRGVEYYSPGAGIRLLTRWIQTFMDTIDQSQIRSARGEPSAAYDAITQNLWVALSTDGVVNNRVLVMNLLKEGRNWIGSPAIDDKELGAETTYLFLEGVDGYLTTDPGGFELRTDSEGYATLAVPPDTGVATSEDANGYLQNAGVDTTVPATLFMGPSLVAGGDAVMHSQGSDGFVRAYEDTYDNDDELSDGSGGVNVTMTLVSRPFLLSRPRHRKRVRAVHLSAINDEVVSYTVAVRVAGTLLAGQSASISATNFNQPKRTRVMTSGVGDAPEISIQVTQQTRISLVGISAEILREPV